MEVTTYITHCDRCDIEVIPSSEEDAYEGSIFAYIGEYTSEDGDEIGTEYTVDLCQPCMRDLLFNILPTYGIKVNDK